jgi:hypothetical protein
MSNIINFKDKTSDKTCEIVLSTLQEDISNISDLFILFKSKDDTINVIETSVSLADKALMLQLLQHSISVDLNNTMYFEPEE